MTNNHDYNTPKAGTQNWHIPLNENFRTLDVDVEIRDANDNRSNYAPKEGAKFLATDTGDVYVGDGSKWRAVGRLSSNPAISVQAKEPSNPSEGDVWIDTSN
ncbi:MAG: hypothetical protein ABEJ28_08340 [Salinigranum sp.]